MNTSNSVKIIPSRTDRNVLTLIALICYLAAPNVEAQVNYDEAKDKGAESVIRANQSIAPAQPTASARVDGTSIKNMLSDKLENAGIGSGWRDDKQRFGGVATYQFQIDPNSSLEEYFVLRQVGALAAMLTAQIDIATWLGADAGMEVGINNPGDPYFADKINANVKKEIESRLSQLNEESKKLGGKLETGADITSADRFKIAADALLKKLDKDYNPSKSAGEKSEKINAIRAQSDAIQGQIKEMQAKYEEYQKAYAKSLNSAVNLSYDHVIFGLSAVSWAENLSPKGELTIGLAYVWSPKLAKSAHAALVGDPSLDSENIKGNESLDSWISKQDLSTLGACRYYVDDAGDRWFIGCSAAPNSLDRADQIARLSAIANLYMPLYSRLIGKQVLKQAVKSGTKKSALPAKAAQDFAEELKSFASANTRGVNQIKSKDLLWPAKVTKTGSSEEGSVAVSVVALNAKSATAALSANVKMALAAAATERENNRRKLEQAQLLGIVNNAKKEVPPSRVPGLVNKTQPANTPSTDKPTVQQTKPASNDNLSPQPGVKVTPGKAKDDF